MNSTAQLQDLAAALSEALDVHDIAGAIVQQGVKAMGADAGGIALRTADGLSVCTVSSVGYTSVARDEATSIPLESEIPAAITTRTGEAIWIESDDDWTRFAEAELLRAHSPYSAGACVPLTVRRRVLGALTFSFREPRGFSEDDRGFTLVLAALCAQALDRAQLYEGERRARALAEAQRQRLEAIFEAAPARIAMARGPDHVYEFANSRYVKFLKNRDIVGKPAREVFLGAETQGLITEADRVYRTGEPMVHTEALF